MLAKLIVLLCALFHVYDLCAQKDQLKIPIASTNRSNVEQLILTEIGAFGILRKARPNIPEHLHTGIDIKRTSEGSSLIYPVADGVVISIRTDGPYAQLIIEHQFESTIFWTIYEHIAEIRVGLFQAVSVDQPIARFFNDNELNRYGWQFNHFHFEVLKKRPAPIEPTDHLPYRLFSSYTLVCYDRQTLDAYFHDPLVFLVDYINH